MNGPIYFFEIVSSGIKNNIEKEIFFCSYFQWIKNLRFSIHQSHTTEEDDRLSSKPYGKTYVFNPLEVTIYRRKFLSQGPIYILSFYFKTNWRYLLIAGRPLPDFDGEPQMQKRQRSRKERGITSSKLRALYFPHM